MTITTKVTIGPDELRAWVWERAIESLSQEELGDVEFDAHERVKFENLPDGSVQAVIEFVRQESPQ